ncbi:FAD-binding and (Fe-S)-binding domain-containing protein [Curtobacterium sp. MCSS17_016]|uniref:FAD-binding and (Fe-S)-binding domain-containing protein n=1 Tax=Curtobacterium sp. MCSS17_016 TaxID=2175644 RepID=UPI000DA73FA4|nr:FAD-binding and (Fe-S)-binding domain-containing protein [Curtobacterium sp. MCSS17_016]WIE80551.1 FAD-binding and (Fe-S)-binding domain-containing protein [Curtobacterium sp. MCSS17_016]
MTITQARVGITNGGHDTTALIAALRARVDGEVRFDDGTRATYATDASNYRQVPIGVVVPRSIDAAVETIAVCREHDVPVLNRGGGTSLAGECTNVAVVIDWTKYCDAIESIDVQNRRAVVQPGLVLDAMNAAVAPHDLMWGPKPATHSHCTFGGMLGNNSCGSTAQRYGKAVDNITRLEVLTYDGIRAWVGPTSDDEYERIVARDNGLAELYRGMRAIVDEYGDEIRERYPDIPRRVSGFNLDHLLPEHGFDVARALVGSESTLVTILRAELVLVPTVPAKTFAVFGFPTVFDAADAAPAAAPFDPVSVEGIDDTLLGYEREKRMNPGALDLMPEGKGWLVIEVPGKDKDDADRRTQQLADEFAKRDPAPSLKVFDDQHHKDQILQVREAGLGATAWVPDHPDAWPGWEDAAVPPERAGEYLRRFSDLLDEFDYDHPSMYGHFGHGCIHCRIPFDLTTPGGIDQYSRFVHRAAELVAEFGGSFSGEHGDGQARGALLPIMFGDRLVGAMRRLKRLFDPGNRMNPGKVIDPHTEVQDLRLGTDYRPAVSGKVHFSFEAEGGFDRAALRCVGIGNCRSHTGDVMCPSYRATGEEEHSTRGRSRLLFEMVNGNRPDSVITDGWRSEEVKDALDLCLSCKGCRSDCPVDVDMATYKAEFLSHHYKGRLRPMSHYTMGWLPFWAQIARFAPRIVNAVTQAPGLGRVVRRVGGIEVDRPLPSFAPQRFTEWFAGRGGSAPGVHGDVVLWPDTFTNTFHPGVAIAAVRVLEDAGYRVVVPQEAVCCGLTWISTGQLDAAERILARTGRILAPLLGAQAPGDDTRMVVLEPSCAAVFRSDARELLPQDTNLEFVAGRTRTLAELLRETPDWHPPKIDRDAVMQPHCHQHAILHEEADHAILDEAGVSTETLEGCCGLAGNFGFEPGHLDVSVAVADHALLPALDRAEDDTIVLADGFSCRTQIDQLGDYRRGIHLAELLDGARRGVGEGALPERQMGRGHGPRHTVARERIRQALGAFPGRKS